jgi:hypothetical protein
MMAHDEQQDHGDVMRELQYIRDTLNEVRDNQIQVNKELAGNGGPGIRTRIHSLETGYDHVIDRLRVMEKKDDERADCLHALEKQIVAIRNIGAGVVIALMIAEALRWIVPVLQTP